MHLIKSVGFKASEESALEIYNHADTYVVGEQALIKYDYGRLVSVQTYDPSLGSLLLLALDASGLGRPIC